MQRAACRAGVARCHATMRKGDQTTRAATTDASNITIAVLKGAYGG